MKNFLLRKRVNLLFILSVWIVFSVIIIGCKRDTSIENQNTTNKTLSIY
jgi:hypothetical protein